MGEVVQHTAAARSANTRHLPLQQLAKVYDTSFGLSSDFTAGLRLLESGRLKLALAAVTRARNVTDATNVYKNKYAAYQGLLMVLTGDERGLDVCRYAASREQHDIDVFNALAHAEHFAGNRRQAITVIKRGLCVDPTHPGLYELRATMGVRGKPVIPFLSRDHVMNRVIGRWRCARRRAS